MFKVAIQDKVVTKTQVQDFISHEMSLLDEENYSHWLALFNRMSRYRVPANPVNYDTLDECMEDIDDNFASLQKRIQCQQKQQSKTKVKHVITSVTLHNMRESRINASASMLMFKQRGSRQYLYTANSRYLLRQKNDDSFEILYKEVRLDNRCVANHGAISRVI